MYTDVSVPKASPLVAVVRACRIYQWVKNTLIFVPLVMAHKLADFDLVLQAFWAFVAFSFCASSVYIVNDLVDIEHDRQHPDKRHRPFASGALPVKAGVLMAAMLLASSFIIAGALLPGLFAALLVLYLLASNAYSFFLKRVAVLDVLLLAGLYALRILSGGAAVGVTISNWLLAFSLFFFIGLAFLKRFAELAIIQNLNGSHASGRGYAVRDMDLIRSFGSTSGYLSVLVLALYIHNSADVVQLYEHPNVLWLIGPCLLYWITRMWLLAHRGVMRDDPIIFTVRDPASYAVGALVALTVIGAAL